MTKSKPVGSADSQLLPPLANRKSAATDSSGRFADLLLTAGHISIMTKSKPVGSADSQLLPPLANRKSAATDSSGRFADLLLTIGIVSL